MNENLGGGIAVFQGLSNIALNCECVFTVLTYKYHIRQIATIFLSILDSHVWVLCLLDAGIVLGTIFAGGTLISRNEMSPGDLMSFLVASQTVQR